MSSNSKKKKKSTSSLSSSEVQITEKNNKNKSKNLGSRNKKVWTSAELSLQMKPTHDEIRYREKKIELDSSVEKYSKYFKCTKCQLSFKPLDQNLEKIAIHSYLKVLFCKSCLDFYEDGEFSMDSDGEEKYCRWCGEGGLIYSCSICVSGFCTVCVKKHFGVKYNGQVRRNNKWQCFLCFPKPLWFLRFICSVVAEETNYKINVLTPDGKQKNMMSEDLKSQDCNGVVKGSSSRENAAKEFEDEESATSSSVILSTSKRLPPEVVVLDTPASGKSIKRKRVVYSSSDDSDDGVVTKNVKKIKTRESLERNSKKRSSGQNIVRPEILEKLEKILRLAEYQMGFGVSWSSKMLAKLYKPNSLSTKEEMKNECQKIKWFFSILSTYLVESCSSVDLIEKSIESNEQKMVNSPDRTHQGDYSTVVKFLDFVTNQVKIFLEKGICLQDLLEGEVYHDGQIIGIKVKSNASANISNASQSLVAKGKIKFTEKVDTKSSNWEKMSDDESTVPTLELDAERDSSETDDYMKKRLSLSDPTPEYLEDTEEQKSKIQEILSILENA